MGLFSWLFGKNKKKKNKQIKLDESEYEVKAIEHKEVAEDVNETAFENNNKQINVEEATLEESVEVNDDALELENAPVVKKESFKVLSETSNLIKFSNVKFKDEKAEKKFIKSYNIKIKNMNRSNEKLNAEIEANNESAENAQDEKYSKFIETENKVLAEKIENNNNLINADFEAIKEAYLLKSLYIKIVEFKKLLNIYSKEIKDHMKSDEDAYRFVSRMKANFDAIEEVEDDKENDVVINNQDDVNL